LMLIYVCFNVTHTLNGL